MYTKGILERFADHQLPEGAQREIFLEAIETIAYSESTNRIKTCNSLQLKEALLAAGISDRIRKDLERDCIVYARPEDRQGLAEGKTRK